MDFLEIEKNEMIQLLLNDNKINVVREAVINDSYDEMIKKERLNYCSDEELNSIVTNEDELLSILFKYSANEKIIDLVIDKFIEYETAIKFFIFNYMDKLNPNQLEKLIKYPNYREFISDNLERANEESIIFLYKNNIITVPTQKQNSIILPTSFVGVDIKTLSLNNICIASYDRKFNLEELDYAINKIFETKIDLYMKGHIDCLLQSQEIPDVYLKKMVFEWDYTPDELWFERMLEYQNLDSVIDYILDKYSLNKDAIYLIITNSKTSPKKLIRLYEKYFDLIIQSGSKTMPVLDCHLHMC